MAKGARREGRRSCAEGGDEVRFADLIKPTFTVYIVPSQEARLTKSTSSWRRHHGLRGRRW